MRTKLVKLQIPVKHTWPFTDNSMDEENYTLIDKSYDIDGNVWYSVRVNEQISDWLFNTFNKDIDFIYVHQLKGVWVDMPEKVYVLLKLKWTV